MTRVLALLLTLAPSFALAQAQFPTPSGQAAGGNVLMCLNGSNQAVPCTGATWPGSTGGAVTKNFPSTTVGTSSAQVLAAAAATKSLTLQNVSVSSTISCRWGGTAVLNGVQNFTLYPGQAASWGAATAGIPNVVLNCIASAASSPLYVEYN